MDFFSVEKQWSFEVPHVTLLVNPDALILSAAVKILPHEMEFNIFVLAYPKLKFFGSAAPAILKPWASKNSARF